MNKIKPNSNITIQVPRHYAGIIIGRKGKNIKVWKKMLGVSKIQIIPI